MAMDFQPTAYITMLNGRKNLNNSTTTALRVGSSNLEGRKWLLVINSDVDNIYVGSESAIGTVLTAAEIQERGIMLKNGDSMWMPVGDNITVYAVTRTEGGKRVRIAELA